MSLLDSLPRITEEQKKDEKYMLNRLIDKGWQRIIKTFRSNSATLTYKNGCEITLEYHFYWQDNSINLKIHSPAGLLFLVIYYKDKLEEFLDVLVQIQDTISPKNYREKIGQIMLVCPSIFVNTGEELVPLVFE